MKSLVFSKFNKFIYYPDLANKFILSSFQDIQTTPKYYIYLKYIFSQRRNYNYIAVKALMMLTSVFPKRCLMNTKLIILKYTPTRCHSVIYLRLNFYDFIPTINYFSYRPSEPSTVMHGHLKESKHFIFPGFIKHLKLPHWERLVTISFNQSSINNLYPLFFHKTAYLD
uniref:Hypothetical mitochondrial protein 23 n=1 Tax=Physarum polycephalum TaxID=5791 RepID=F2Y9T7_PHYPO|nr:hypothetical mitochondrial protein 23 [Physarum polycephalum]